MFSAHLGNTFADPAHPASWLHARFIHTTMLMCIGIFVVQVPWYLLRCRRILLERLQGRRNHWAQLPLAIVFTTWALAILRTIDCAFIKWPPLFSAIVAVISVGVTVGALYVLLREFAAPEAGADPYAKSRLGRRFARASVASSKPGSAKTPYIREAICRCGCSVRP